MTGIKLARMNSELVADEIGDFIINEIVPIGYTGGVIGLSGGVDSTTSAALAKRAFDKYNLNSNKKLELVGCIMPSNTNSSDDERDARKVADRLGIRYEIIPIEPVIEGFRKVIPKIIESSYIKGNLKAEIRATLLHQLAGYEKKLVIGTGNRDEDFGVGYYTLFGDGAVHMSPLGGLPKRLVRQMACYLGFSDLANRIPTAGLEAGQTDFKDLGYYYETVEGISEGKLQGFSRLEIINDDLIKELARKDISDYTQIYGKSKFSSAKEIVNNVFMRMEIAKAKGKIVSPPQPKISLGYL
ncbi:MAG: NAD(+) synthase [Nanoarchaeota archaeon]|nr:NAD(+) synthase [Nanoarchaeota archaeon]